MRRKMRKAAFAAPFLFGPVMARAQSGNDFSAPRNAVVDASGARSVRVEAGAGILRVEGKAGITQVQIKGMAWASSREILNDIKLVVERRGSEIFIKTDLPESNFIWGRGDWSAALDLTVEVPQGLDASVYDGSGATEIRNVGTLEATDGSGDLQVDGAKSVRITDGSGSLVIKNISGDVKVRDGSGDIEARNVAGSFTVESDGSGGIFASDIKGSVVVEHDGSGEINASRVGRDLVVESKGSGEVTYNGVTGRVDVPERRRSRSRNNY
ncbi:MAG: DUF2807 domain-containing protein [Gemmatimonadaceae bacterium]|nr:DUF2807 domain-containing protein [Gemmatimonadaceae bacterium]